MDVLPLLRDQNAMIAGGLSQTLAGLTPESAVWTAPGSTANTIAGTMLHTCTVEDEFLNNNLGQPTVYERGDWQARFGVAAGAVWQRTAEPTLDALREYADAVQAVTRQYLDTAVSTDLDRVLDVQGEPPIWGARLSVILVVHKVSHLGLVTAPLGMHGLRGSEF